MDSVVCPCPYRGDEEIKGSLMNPSVYINEAIQRRQMLERKGRKMKLPAWSYSHWIPHVHLQDNALKRESQKQDQKE